MNGTELRRCPCGGAATGAELCQPYQISRFTITCTYCKHSIFDYSLSRLIERWDAQAEKEADKP